MKIKNAALLSMLVVIVQNHMGAIVTPDNLTSGLFLNCSFENGMCNWNNISVGWKIRHGSCAKSGTGPKQDHTLGNDSGSYLYLDSKSVNVSQIQMLQSPLVQWNDSCLSLWYHMRGSDIGNLSIYIETNITTIPNSTTTQSSNRTILWSQEGEHDDKWYAVEITIQTQEAFRVLLEGTTKGERGEIAVDDIKLSKYSCKDICSFDVGYCNWMQNKSDGFRWNRTSGNTSSRKTGPQSGHTNGAVDDYYMHIDASLGNQSTNAILRHAGLYRSGPACLSFWYHMYGKDMGNLNLYTSRNDEPITAVWCKNGDQGNNWNFAAVDVEVGPDVSVEFEAVRGYGGRSDMALDDISMIIGNCSEHCTRSTSTTRDLNKCCVNFNGNETKQNTATLFESCGTNSQTATSGSQTTCCVNFNGNETKQITATLFESCGTNSQTTTSRSQTTCCVNFNGNETKQITATLFESCCTNSQTTTSRSQTTCCVNFNGNETKQITATLFESFGADSQTTTSGSQTTSNENDSVAKGTWAISNGSDLEDSTNNTTSLAESSVSISQTTGTIRQTTTLKQNATATDGIIIGSVFGAAVFVAVSLLVGVWKCRKRHRHSKKAESIELRPISSKLSTIEDGRGDYSSAAHFVNPVYTQSSNAARLGNTALINVKIDNENYEYASAFTTTTPVQWTGDAYDTCDETKHHFDGTYDHMPTQFIEEYEATQLTMHTRQDANEIYDHVTLCPDVYDEISVMAQATAIQYKSYDHATKGMCETPVSKQNISNGQDDIYELIA